MTVPTAEAFYAGKTYYDMVRDFHKMFGHPIGDHDEPQALDVRRQVARMEWMVEELIEFVSSDHLVNQVDAMLDLLYFVLGCHVEMGCPIEVSFYNVDARGEMYPALPLVLKRPGQLEICRKILKLIFHYGKMATLEEQYTCLATLSQAVMDGFARLGCNPKGLFELVHESNMGKAWPDGTVKYDPMSGKILKCPAWEPPEPLLKKEIIRRVKEYYANHADDEDDDIPF